MLQGKTILLGVTGGIACFKAAALASLLKKQGADVQVIMTENATQFVTPLTFEQLTGNKALVDTFDRNFQYNVAHIAVADRADFVLIAPATANVIAKLAHGLADDMLTTTVLACRCPKAVAPAMNTNMFENPVTQDNLQILRRYGWEIVDPASGHLACGATGKGRLPEPEDLAEVCLHALAHEKDMAGKRVLVTAGPTQEALDPVRYLTNHSSGRMGYAIAKAAARRGAEVVLVSGPTALKKPAYVETVDVISAQDMFEAVTSRAPDMDIIIKAAAVADYRPVTVADNKIKKKEGDMAIPLERTKDILGTLGENKRPSQFLCGFSMETEDMVENSQKKLEKKRLDMIAANNVKEAGAGFGVDTNILTLITPDGMEELPLMSKDAAADALLDAILQRMGNAMVDEIKELNNAKDCSKALEHPTWEALLSLLSLYGVEDMQSAGLIDTSHDAQDIRWNYIIDKKYVLRLTNAPEMTEQRLMDLNRLIARYAQFGLRCPAFLKGTDGRFFHSWGALTVYLSEYADLPLADEADLTPAEEDALRQEVVLSIAGFLERYKGVDLIPIMGMYSLFDLCPYDVPEGIDEKQWNMNNLTAALRKHGEEALAARLEAKNDQVRARLLAVYKDLPRCVTQADEGFGNVLLDEKKHMAGLIDFNLSGTDVCVNLIANNADFDLDIMHDKPLDPAETLEKALASYRKHAALLLEVYHATEAEREALADYAWIALASQYPYASNFEKRLDKEEARPSTLALLEMIAALGKEQLFV